MKAPEQEKIEDLIDHVDTLLAAAELPAGVIGELEHLREELVKVVNPQSEFWKGWRHATSGTLNKPLDVMYCEAKSGEAMDLSLEVSFYMGLHDGKPVIQIDGTGDFRINVNDSPIWDQSTESHWTGGSNAAD